MEGFVFANNVCTDGKKPCNLSRRVLRLCEVILKSKVPKVNVPECPAVVSFCCCSDWLVVLAEDDEVVELLLKLCVVVGVEADWTDVNEGLRVKFGFEVDGAVNNKKETRTQ